MDNASSTLGARAYDCPEEATLQQVLEGSNAVEAWLLKHLDDCTRCQTRLDRLSDTGPLLEYRGQLIENTESSFLDPPMRKGDLGALDGLAIEAQIGSGGMGIVYRGRDDRMNRHVAVKVLRHFDQPRAIQRFQREVRAAGQLQHDHLVPIHSAGYARDGRPYLVMPLIEGQSLREQIAGQPLEIRFGAKVVREVACGLSFAHEAGLIHRDIKPANILLELHSERAKLTDFGLSRSSSDGTLTQLNVVCGTPEYMAPEQASNPDSCDPRCDQYSLGVTLYECLTGSPPFRGRPLDLIEQHRNHDPVPPSRLNRMVPRDLETICLKAMAREPSRRYASTAALAHDLDCFLSDRPIAARPVSWVTRGWLWCCRNPQLAMSTAALLVMLIAGTAVSTMLWQLSERKGAESRALASSLTVSRARLRESVRQFQARVLNAESLHWNMDVGLQSQLFADVIRNLDEFAAGEPTEAMTDVSDKGVVDELSHDYLQVAQAALATRRLNDVRLAASRAFQRLSELTVHPQHQNTANWLAQCQAARLISRAAKPEYQVAMTLNSLDAWQEKASIAADCAVAADSENPLTRLAQLQVRLDSQKSAASQSRELDCVGLKQIHTALTQLDLTWQQKTPALLMAGWLLSRVDTDGSIWLDRNEVIIGTLREQLRIVRRPLFSTDRYLAINHWHRGWLAQVQGDWELARRELQAAVDCFTASVEYERQNHFVTQEGAEALAALARLQAEAGLLPEADRTQDQVLKIYLNLLERDPAHAARRVRLIGHFVWYGELSARMNEPIWVSRSFATAAQDCNLLLGEPLNDPTNLWALQTKIWCLQRVASVDLPASGGQSGQNRSAVEDAMNWLEKSWPGLCTAAREMVSHPPAPTPPLPPVLDEFGSLPIDPLRLEID